MTSTELFIFCTACIALALGVSDVQRVKRGGYMSSGGSFGMNYDNGYGYPGFSRYGGMNNMYGGFNEGGYRPSRRYGGGYGRPPPSPPIVPEPEPEPPIAYPPLPPPPPPPRPEPEPVAEPEPEPEPVVEPPPPPPPPRNGGYYRG